MCGPETLSEEELKKNRCDFGAEIVAHPLWKESPYWDPRQFAVLGEKTRTHGWTADDFTLATKVWNPMNIVLWYRLFVEGKDRPSA